MITQRIDQLKYADIERLVLEEREPEGRMLDYKRQLPGGTSDDVKELLADVTSFANASGGHLVFGVSTRKENGKNTAIPDAILGVGDINLEQETLRLENLLTSSIQPRIVGLRVRAIPEAGKPTVVVIHTCRRHPRGLASRRGRLSICHPCFRRGDPLPPWSTPSPITGSTLTTRPRGGTHCGHPP